MKKHEWYDCMWKVEHIRDGKVIFSQYKHNDLTNSGERSILNAYFRNTEVPTTFYVRLCRNFIGITDTLASVVETSGSGYEAQQVERSAVGFPSIELDGADYRLVSKTISFSATGTWTPSNYMFLSTSSDNSGVLIASAGLENELNMVNGDIFRITFKLKLR
jgi:hypothetical protein